MCMWLNVRAWAVVQALSHTKDAILPPEDLFCVIDRSALLKLFCVLW
eukprot:SAG31_NODE_681_length_12844_cov_31.703021_9_plen_47_part_00